MKAAARRKRRTSGCELWMTEHCTGLHANGVVNVYAFMSDFLFRSTRLADSEGPQLLDFNL